MPSGKPVKRKLRSHLTTKPYKGVVNAFLARISGEREGRKKRGGYKPWWPLPKYKFVDVSFLMFFWVMKPLMLFAFPALSGAYSPPLPYLLRQFSACKELVRLAWWSLLGWSCLAFLLTGCLRRYLPEKIIAVVKSYFTCSYFSSFFLSHKDNMGKKITNLWVDQAFDTPVAFLAFPLIDSWHNVSSHFLQRTKLVPALCVLMLC